MSESEREGDAAVERPAREVAEGRTERTPFLLIGGIGGAIALVAGTLIGILLLLWWAL